jgi:hypothetical protein
MFSTKRDSSTSLLRMHIRAFITLLIVCRLAGLVDAAYCSDFTAVPGYDVAYYWTHVQSTFPLSQNYCDSTILAGTSLPYITDLTLFQFVKNLMNFPGSWYWAALKQLDNSSTSSSGWYWLNGTSSSTININWASGQPNENGGGLVEQNVENCGCVSSDNSGISDCGCGYTWLNIVCELKGTIL